MVRSLVKGLLILLLLVFGIAGFIVSMEYDFLPLMPASVLCIGLAGYWAGRRRGQLWA